MCVCVCVCSTFLDTSGLDLSDFDADPTVMKKLEDSGRYRLHLAADPSPDHSGRGKKRSP